MLSLLSLTDLQRMRRWMQAHRRTQPVEYHCWDTVLTLGIMGAIGWLPALIVDQGEWALPLCALGFWLPSLYVRWRMRAQIGGRLRCDWLDVLTSTTVRP